MQLFAVSCGARFVSFQQPRGHINRPVISGANFSLDLPALSSFDPENSTPWLPLIFYHSDGHNWCLLQVLVSLLPWLPVASAKDLERTLGFYIVRWFFESLCFKLLYYFIQFDRWRDM
jgi:hypothetical protein